MADRLQEHCLTRTFRLDLLILSTATLLMLGPFVHKAFHVDDPLFIWAAKQIEKTPSDFYRFDVNWYGTSAPAFTVIKNPPLASYYIALASRVCGWSEAGLHLAFLFPAVACIIGTYLLASRFCSRPLLAALCLLVMPGFLVSSTTIMCDTLMLAFWIWAVFLWEKGFRNHSFAIILIATFLVGLAGLTKYFGISLVPLLLVFAGVNQRKLDWRLLALLVPVAMLAAYEWYTRTLYGRGLLSDATVYVSEFRNRDLLRFAVTGLAFTGGCVLVPLCYFRQHWSTAAIVGGLTVAIVSWLLVLHLVPANLLGQMRPEIVPALVPQIVALSILGAVILILPFVDLYRTREANSLLLLLWVGGTFVFASLLNWTINARSLLPVCPAIAILAMRRLDQRTGCANKPLEPRLIALLTPALLISLLVAYSDYEFANRSRNAAYLSKTKHTSELSTLWFEGHWGFQYYMESVGAKPVDFNRSVLENGDVLVVPGAATNIFSIPPEALRLTFVVEIGKPFLATMDRGMGAGFYASEWGPMPFVFGAINPQPTEIFLVTHQLRFVPRD